MNYLTRWSFDPLVVLVVAAVALHEGGLARLARRSTPSALIWVVRKAIEGEGSAIALGERLLLLRASVDSVPGVRHA